MPAEYEVEQVNCPEFHDHNKQWFVTNGEVPSAFHRSYLHRDGVWRWSTYDGDEPGGYFNTREEAQEAINLARNQE